MQTAMPIATGAVKLTAFRAAWNMFVALAAAAA
jgi:hypothetical protein